MILILKNNLHLFAQVLTVVALLLVSTPHAFAQESLTLSVTPTLFEMSATPGQFWQSQVKVVNVNSFPITVYAEAVNFAPQGETGQGKFIPIFDELTDGATFAEWFTIENSDGITIPPGTSQQIPFSVNVPEDAAPGGHFAAILVGTQPPEEDGRLVMRTSQVVSTLAFARVEGDVIESGTIRSFSVEDRMVAAPEATFSLRFENKGNVHLQPQGHITIFNMWGKERGLIPINNETHFGNVLPESIRKFEFSWEGERSLTDIGRYKAITSLAYGTDERKFQSSAAYFWVIPVKATLLTLFLLGALIYLITWVIKAYVRRMLSLAGLDPDRMNDPRNDRNRKMAYKGDVTIEKKASISAPLRSGWNDLRNRIAKTKALKDTFASLLEFSVAYKLFFMGLAVLLIVVMSVVYFFKSVNSDRDYSVEITNADQSTSLNSEEIALQKYLQENNLRAVDADQAFTLVLVNTSDTSGIAAKAAGKLIADGYEVERLDYDEDRVDTRTVVVYDLIYQDDALALSKKLGGALLSVRNDASATENITVYIGKDQINN